MKIKDKRKTRVIVAMSGGVDSSVAAFLLCRQGYQVIGATFENGYGQPSLQAADICRQLGIEHHVIDIRDSFNKQVVQPFLAAYLSGRTPNPCVLSNSSDDLLIIYNSMMNIYPELTTSNIVSIKKAHNTIHINSLNCFFSILLIERAILLKITATYENCTIPPCQRI